MGGAEKDVKFIKRLNVTDYQNKEFVIEDIDGRWLAFGLKLKIKYSLQGTTQGRYLTGGVPPVRFSM